MASACTIKTISRAIKTGSCAISEFEFLRGLPFGPYMAVDSPLHRLDPRTRILLVILFLVVLILANRPAGMMIGLAATLLGWLLARISFTPLWRGWRAALPFLLFLAALQVLLRTGENGETVLFSYGWLSITATDLWYGLALLLRFSGFMAVLGLAASFLSESELTRGLEALLSPLSVLRVPTHDFVMVIQVTLRYFPLLSQTAERIAKAQASRGADWQPTGWNLVRRARQIIPMIVPLFIASLRRAENMALAMDARGYGTLPIRTSMIILHFRLSDLVAFMISIPVLLAVVVL
jgi:energy-coupling factor transport system permease protein